MGIQGKDNKRLREYKRRAKQMKRTGVGTYVKCLDQIARNEGFKNWWALRQSVLDNGAATPLVVRFGVDRKDAWDSQLTRPWSGFRQLWDFYPDPVDPDSSADEDYDDLDYFQFVGVPPTTVEDAVRRIRKFTFHPPERLWFDDEEVDPYPHEIRPGVRAVGGECTGGETDWRVAPKPSKSCEIRLAFSDDHVGRDEWGRLVDEGYQPTIEDGVEGMLDAAAMMGLTSRDEIIEWVKASIEGIDPSEWPFSKATTRSSEE